ncbi:FIST C-terminal domain-containing protein [Shewanella sp. SG41-4]|uniref:FIST signal transduction protein n=1 Tax=Shewanella sp. SG41-4 TaxID=2760976 RepID=UPI0015FFB2B2|nr:FIST N-terminal domain-containing protein [Shewanella sp. SG41-4]MBB1440709.1 FIST C-terminal domain-containing protein [Shewanella sp. SG41-4]
MHVYQTIYQNNHWTTPLPQSAKINLVLAFGSPELMLDQKLNNDLSLSFPNAQIVGCSTSGEIQDDYLYDNSICVTAIEFDHTQVQVVSDSINKSEHCTELAQQLVSQLSLDGLKHVFVISDGHLVNGSELVDGLQQYLPQGVMATGGLAGDGERFQQTTLWHNERIESGLIVLVGLYGEKLSVGFGSLGGWRSFGPKRVVTKSADNVLYELDGRPALELYKEFLGEFSAGLPASALLYPLALQLHGEQEHVVRTILSIDEQQKSMLFAGNMPEGATCQLMHSSYEDLLDGAQHAADDAMSSFTGTEPELAILISCVGRRLVLRQRVEEELEIIKQGLPGESAISGFYSYGEISPIKSIGRCGLHNQTMTVTLLSEK